MKTNRIKLALLIDKSGAYDRRLMRGIINYSKLSPVWDFFFNSPEYMDRLDNNEILKKLKLWKPDFIVMNEMYLIPEYFSLKVPILVTPSKTIIPNVINIIADDDKIGELAANYFINKGFENFAFYGSDSIFWSKRRKTSFEKVVSSAGFRFFEYEPKLNKGWMSNPENFISWMKKLPVPIAFMGCCDDFAVQIIEAAHMAGLLIPEDVAILGVDNDEFICELYNPHMSSIDQDSENVGFKVAQYLYKYFMTGEWDSDMIVGSNFYIVSRRSTDIYAVEDQELSKALYFIKNKAHENICVSDVVAVTNLSRRLLEIRFRNLLNRSILQ